MPFTKLKDKSVLFVLKDIPYSINLPQNSQLALMHHHLDRPSKLHFHDYIEICYVASGRLIHIIDKAPFVMTAGDLIVIPEKKEHLLAPLEQEKPILINLLIHPNLLVLVTQLTPTFSISNSNTPFLKILLGLLLSNTPFINCLKNINSSIITIIFQQ